MREKGRYKNVKKVKIGGVKKMREKRIMREKNEGNFLHSLSSSI